MLQQAAFVACGALVAEVCLLGIWCGLSVQSLKYRLPGTCALVLLAACTISIGLQIADGGPRRSGMPVEVALVIAAASYGMFAVLQIPLWLVRKTKQLRIASRIDTNNLEPLRSRQFSLGYLMLWTALVGVLLVIVRESLPRESGGVRMREIVEIALATICYVVLSSLLSMPCLWLVLAKQRSWSALVALGCTLVGGPVFILICSSMIFVRQLPDEILPGVACYEVGLTGTSIVVLLVLRLTGYRMVDVGSKI